MNEQQKKKSRVGIGRMAKLMWVRAVGWGRALGNLFYYGARRLRQRLGPWWQGTGRKMAVSGFVRLAAAAVICVMALGLVNYSYKMYSFRQPLSSPSIKQEAALDYTTAGPDLPERQPAETVIEEEAKAELSGRVALGPPPEELFPGQALPELQGDIEVTAAAAGSREEMLSGADTAPSRPPVNPAAMIWPVSGQVSVGYGWIRHPVYRDWRFHPGIELATAPDAQVAAVMDGQVRRIQSDRTQGLSVTVDHGDGWETTYRGLSQLRVKEGLMVSRGQVIGTAGSGAGGEAGRLVFEIRHGDTPLEPRMYLP